jgi:hypothetical protein
VTESNPYAAPQNNAPTEHTDNTKPIGRRGRRFLIRGAVCGGTLGLVIVLPMFLLDFGVPVNSSFIVVPPVSIAIFLPELMAFLFGGAGWFVGMLMDEITQQQ